MKALLLVLLMIGLAAALPFPEASFEEEAFEAFAEDKAAAGGKKPEEEGPPLWLQRFLQLLTKSVANVKPDEHPDKKYEDPGVALVKKLKKVKAAVVEMCDPLHDIIKLLIEDHKTMMKRVEKAVEGQNIPKAKHVVGEYFIALNRRFVMLFSLAASKGLFNEIPEEKKIMKEVKKQIDNVKRGIMNDKGEHDKFAMHFVTYFNRFRVSDGLLDAPFVKLGVKTIKELEDFLKQIYKVVHVTKDVYIDMVVDMARLSLDEKNHEGAVQRAGAGVICTMRRKIKILMFVAKMHEKKQCMAPGLKHGKKPGQKMPGGNGGAGGKE